jgi:hypothetical protein
MPKVNTTDDLLKLERVVRKVINKAFKDRTLDYTVQFSVSSLEPKKVKYSFMINGTKKEIRVEPQSFYSFDQAVAVAEGMLKEIDLVELEKTFHQSRINTHKTAQEQHEARLNQLENPEPEDDIPMEEA